MRFVDVLVTAITWIFMGPFWHAPMAIWRFISARGNVFLALVVTLPAMDTLAGGALWLFGASSGTIDKWCYPVAAMAVTPAAAILLGGIGGVTGWSVPLVWLSVAILTTSHLSPIYIAMVRAEQYRRARSRG